MTTIILSLVLLTTARAQPLAPVQPDSAFWKHWGDGQAELAGYRVTYPRYGEPREGNAVAIFVTETFASDARVKSDPGKRDKKLEFPVIKLNLAIDFPTGVYDYNLMTSAFVALAPVNGRAAGQPTKVAFSAQEWCGQVYHHVLFDESRVREVLHSYFDGEADQANTLANPADGISEDTLLLWARGLAAPTLKPGESRKLKMLDSLAHARLRHQPLAWHDATVSRSDQTQKVTVPAGEIDCRTYTAAIEGGRTWTIHVEDAAPHRLVQWQTSDGQKAQLLGADRMPYWQMNSGKFIESVKRFGLTPRGADMP
jgi:hypothetical protein